MTTTVRPAQKQDGDAILSLLQQLAAFEKAPDGIALTMETLNRDAFGSAPKIDILLAEQDGETIGMVILVQAYSSWRGAKTLIIHDLFVCENARGSGAGRILLAEAARLAGERGCCRLDVNVLDWNAPARRFYESLGFEALTAWIPHRLDEDAMKALASLASA